MNEKVKKELEDICRELIPKFKVSPNSLINDNSIAIWTVIPNDFELSEGFMREFQDKLNWITVSRCRKLSDEFIIEFQNKIEFNYYCEYNQYISENIVRKLFHKMEIEYLLLNKKLSNNIKNLIKIYQ